MSVNIETPVSNDTLQSLDPLKTTTDAVQLTRVWVEVFNPTQWYSVIREAGQCYGKAHWRSQSRVRRKLENNWARTPHWVWFDVPDATFASWVSVKLGLKVSNTPNK